MPYKDQVVLFDGGIHRYVGQIDQAKHKMGEGWWRILNPCEIAQGQQNGKPVNVLVAFHYPKRNFKRYVDLYIPRDSLIEIRTLDHDGDMYKEYCRVMERQASDLIHLAGVQDMPVQ